SEGKKLPIERNFRSRAPKIKDRFTSENLRALLACFRFPMLDEEHFQRSDRYALFEERHSFLVKTCTPAQADSPAYRHYQDGPANHQHIEKHPQYILDRFLWAIEGDPSFEPLVREHVAQAKAILKDRRRGR